MYWVQINSLKKARACEAIPSVNRPNASQENNFIRDSPQTERNMVRSSRCPVGGMPPKAHLESHLTAEIVIKARQFKKLQVNKTFFTVFAIRFFNGTICCYKEFFIEFDIQGFVCTFLLAHRIYCICCFLPGQLYFS